MTKKRSKGKSLNPGFIFGISMSVFFILRDIVVNNPDETHSIFKSVIAGIIAGVASGLVFGWIMSRFAGVKKPLEESTKSREEAKL